MHSSEHSLTTTITSQAFHVDDSDGDGNEQDDNVVPTSAAEYLRMVRRQASAMPNVFVAHGAHEAASTAAAENASQSAHESSAIASTRMAPMPAFAKPNEAWRQEFLSWFQALQETLARNKNNADPDAVPNPNIPDPSNGAQQKWRRLIYDPNHHVQPSADMLSQLDYMQVSAALEVFDVCLGEVHPVPRDGSVPDASKLDGRRIRDDICTGHRSSWLFSLLACLQLYVPQLCAALS